MMSGPPPTIGRCLLGCGHQAHGGRECGALTFFTHRCTCPRVYDPAKDRDPPDFDERKAYREHDEDWYPR